MKAEQVRMLVLGQTARILSQDVDIKREKHLVHTLGTETLHTKTTTYSAAFMGK